MRIIGLLALVAGLSVAAGTRAAVVEAQPWGFQVETKVVIAAPAAKVWDALGHYGDWWDGKHSWSGDARNLHLDLAPGGCLCETLPNGGGAHHGTVIMVIPGKRLVLDSTLGPLMFSGAAGHWVFTLDEKDGATTLTEDYYVGGFFPGGLDKLAPAVDGVLGYQTGRLKAFVETGKAG